MADILQPSSQNLTLMTPVIPAKETSTYDAWFNEHFQGVTRAIDIANTDRIKCIVLGPYGSGKSWLLTTARQPILIYDLDDRRESIANKSGVFIKTLVDADVTRPHVWKDIESDLGSLEYLKQQGKLEVKSIGLDTLNSLHKAATNEMMNTAGNSALMREKQIGTQKYRIGQGWDSVNYVQRMMDNILNRFFALDIDIYCTAHIRRQKAADSTEDNPKFTGKWTIDPQNIEFLLSKFNERWMMKDEFQVQTKPDYEFNAITALQIDQYMKSDIKEMLELHNSRLKK